MTIEINLLPWREEQRERRSKRFYMALGLAALLGIGGGYGMSWYYQQGGKAQHQRNAHIEARSRQFDPAIREVIELERVRGQVVEQVRVFTELQNGRTQTVHLMSDLTTSLVDGVYYTRLDRQGDNLRLSGMAENNRQVSDQLRALESAASFSELMLSEVEAEDDSGRRSFSLGMSQQVPDVGMGEEDAGVDNGVEKEGA